MTHRSPKTFLLLLSCALALGVITFGSFAGSTDNLRADTSSRSAPARPLYSIYAAIDYDLLTFKSTGTIRVPVRPGDTMNDVVCFLYANSSGVGGEDSRRKNIVVDKVALSDSAGAYGPPTSFVLNGPVLRIKLPQPQSEPFTLRFDWHGVVPKAPPGGGGIMDMMGGDLSSLLGGLGGEQGAPKPKNVDYGLYTYGNGVLSLGSFWYPSLAVRKDGKWDDEAPEGLGDVGYSELSDFQVALKVPDTVKVAATGESAEVGGNRAGTRSLVARGVRDFSVLMSEDFVVSQKPFDIGGKQVMVFAYTTKANAAKSAKAIDIAGNALRIFSKRFGPYPYDNFKVVEGTIRGGAGGMEFSGLTSIASMLYGDMGKQLAGLGGALGMGDVDKMLRDLDLADEGTGAQPAPKANGPQAEGMDNPAAELATGMLGQQMALLNSLFETTIAHEVAHQWWAMVVGSDSQRAPFVDESLANYSAMLYFEDRYGPEAAQRMMELHLKTTYSMGRMLGGGDAPVNLKTAAYKNNMQYGAVVYGKGALYYDALRGLVGDEVFFAALREYYSQYSGRLAPSRALLDIVKAKAPARAQQVNALFTRWIEGTHGDEDISGGQVAGIQDLLGGLLGGMGGGDMLGE